MNPEDKDDDLLEQLRNESNESSDREVVEEIQPQTPQSTSTQTPTRDQSPESLSGVELPPNLLENAQVGLRDFIDNTFQDLRMRSKQIDVILQKKEFKRGKNIKRVLMKQH